MTLATAPKCSARERWPHVQQLQTHLGWVGLSSSRSRTNRTAVTQYRSNQDLGLFKILEVLLPHKRALVRQVRGREHSP